MRPTSDRVREAIFDVLDHLDEVDGATVVDLFAGSGALGIEALSRGASFVTFVESDADAAKTVETNLATTGLGGPSIARVVRSDAVSWAQRAEAVDVALVDPPYAFERWDALLRQLKARLVVIESRRPIELPAGLALHRSYHYGGTIVTVARNSSLSEPRERGDDE